MIVQTLTPRYGSVSGLCRLTDLAESSYHYELLGRTNDRADAGLLSALGALAGQYPTYGYRRLGVLVRRQVAFAGVNDKRIRRLMKHAGMQAKTPRQRVSTTQSAHGFERYPNLLAALPRIDYPDQVWACDLTYIKLANGAFVYLAIVLDVFTRMIRGWSLGREITHTLALEALRGALRKRTPDIHHSDQGVQYATPLYTDVLKQQAIQISMSDKAAAWQNGFAERFMLTLKEEEVYLTEYEDYYDALNSIGPFIDAVYNKKRIHSSLGYIAPAQFEREWRAKNR